MLTKNKEIVLTSNLRSMRKNTVFTLVILISKNLSLGFGKKYSYLFQDHKMLVPFRSGKLWHLTLESTFLNADEKIESFLSSSASVETKRLVVYGDSNQIPEDECPMVHF